MPAIGGRSGQPVEVKLPRLGKGLGNRSKPVANCRPPSRVPREPRAVPPYCPPAALRTLQTEDMIPQKTITALECVEKV